MDGMGDMDGMDYGDESNAQMVSWQLKRYSTF